MGDMAKFLNNIIFLFMPDWIFKHFLWNWSLMDATEPHSLQWRHNELDGVSNHQPYDCLINRLFRRGSKLRVTSLCEGNSPVTGEFLAQSASNAQNVSISWRHHVDDKSTLIQDECTFKTSAEKAIGEKTELFQVMALCSQAASHYLSQCWTISVSPCGVTRSQWVQTQCMPLSLILSHLKAQCPMLIEGELRYKITLITLLTYICPCVTRETFT